MDKESLYELQKIDCNCNDCFFFNRDIEKIYANNTNPQIRKNKIFYGYCVKLSKEVAEMGNIALLHTQECFSHRKDYQAFAERPDSREILI